MLISNEAHKDCKRKYLLSVCCPRYGSGWQIR